MAIPFRFPGWWSASSNLRPACSVLSQATMGSHWHGLWRLRSDSTLWTCTSSSSRASCSFIHPFQRDSSTSTGLIKSCLLAYRLWLCTTLCGDIYDVRGSIFDEGWEDRGSLAVSMKASIFLRKKIPLGLVGIGWLARWKLVNLNKKDQGVDLEEFPHWHFLVIYIYIHLVLCDLAPVDSSVDWLMLGVFFSLFGKAFGVWVVHFRRNDQTP